MRKSYIYIIMCSLLIAACGSDDNAPATGADRLSAVDFSATMADDINPASQTRAAIVNPTTSAFGQVITQERLKTQGFGVFGCYTGLYKYVDSNVRPDFMYNECITSADGTNWIYSPVKYWPNGDGMVDGNTGSYKHFVSFMAYAPYSDNSTGAAGYCIPSFSHQGDLGNPWLTYRLHSDVANQVDLLYAAPQLDQTKPADVNEKVSFTFDHALSCVGDQINIICSQGIKNQVNSRVDGSVTDAKVRIKAFSIKYTLTSKARLVLWNNGAAANWQTIMSENPICTRTVNIDPVDVYQSGGIADPYVISDKGVFYIPIELETYPQKAALSIIYCISTCKDGVWTDETDNEGTATLTLHDYAEAYRSGKHLYLNITLNQMNIGFTAAIAPWVLVDPVEVEGEEQ